MPHYQSVKVYTYGFEFDGLMFCWENKELYKMPYFRNKRSHKLRKLKQQKVGNSIGYWIDKGVFKSMKNLKEITKEINHEEVVYINDGVPF